MARVERILTLDVGASRIVLAEFLAGKGTPPELLNYSVGNIGAEGEGQTTTPAFIVSALRELMRTSGMKPARLYMCVSGQVVFPRFVKLPPVTSDKLIDIIHYEAEQNVPFPIDEVIWDYQLVGDTGSGEMNVMLVTAKIESVKTLTDCTQGADLEPEVVDVAPMALYNIVRYNYADLQGCAMILDIGGRSSNLVFIEENRIFSRSIPVAGNAITQEIMKEFDVSWAEAEELKVTQGFVAFGGVYAGPENEVADRVSKVIRNVVTRLHAEINRSINFYRSQQGGSPPTFVLLTGGTSVMPHIDTFFREKMSVDVEMLNPFRSLPVSQALDGDQVVKDLHVLGGVAGLALRHGLTCPVELNLMPPDVVAKKAFRRRLPFFAITAAAIVLILLCWWQYIHRVGSMMDARVVAVKQMAGVLKGKSEGMKAALKEEEQSREKLDKILGVIGLRSQWIEILDAIHENALDGMWITNIRPIPKAETGEIAQIELTGRVFKDKLTKLKQQDESANPLEIFRDRLKKQAKFDETTHIVEMPPMSFDAYAQDFKLVIGLKSPLKMN